MSMRRKQYPTSKEEQQYQQDVQEDYLGAIKRIIRESRPPPRAPPRSAPSPACREPASSPPPVGLVMASTLRAAPGAPV